MSDPTTRSDSSAGASDATSTSLAFTVFAALWAVSALANTWRHFDLSSGPVVYVLESATLAAALLLLLRPGDLRRLVALAIVYALTLWGQMPLVNNHGTLIFVLHLATLGAFVLTRGRTGASATTAFHDTFAPVARLSLLVLYFWATLHKLNTGFLDPDLSCTTTELTKLREHTVLGLPLTFLPDGRNAALVSSYGTIAIEAAIPLLLLFRPTRMTGVWLAALFHFLLGLSYPGFSFMLYALLTLFVPARIWTALGAPWSGRAPPASALGRALRPVRDSWPGTRSLLELLALGVVVFAALLVGTETEVPEAVPVAVLRQVFVVYAGSLLVVLLRAHRRAGGVRETRPMRLVPRAVLLPLVALVGFNGLCPYLGLKTTLCYAMFSNLRTEGGTTNHLFIPASWQVFDVQQDLVTILDSSDDALAWLGRPNFDGAPDNETFVTFNRRTPRQLEDGPPTWKLPYQALRQRITFLAQRGDTDIRLAYERGGAVTELARAEEDPELTSFPYLWSKLVRMRAVPDIPGGCCMW